MIIAWIIFGCFIFITVTSLHGCIYKLAKKQGKISVLAASIIVNLLILTWALVIIFNPYNLRMPWVNYGWGLALCLIFTYQGLPIELPKEQKI